MSGVSYSDIAELKKIIDDQADSLCFLREIVFALVGHQEVSPSLRNRLADRVMKHREFDKKEGRIHE